MFFLGEIRKHDVCSQQRALVTRPLELFDIEVPNGFNLVSSKTRALSGVNVAAKGPRAAVFVGCRTKIDLAILRIAIGNTMEIVRSSIGQRIAYHAIEQTVDTRVGLMVVDVVRFVHARFGSKRFDVTLIFCG
ncbi:MAG: hypothetical protein CL484_14760 [Acidobacteria bacterium]|nr:hypothetical protein [Acidobacteriota bacterium]